MVKSRSYYKIIKKGVQIAKGKNLIICGIVKDAERNIKKNIKRINTLVNYFNDYKVIIFENGSMDLSREILLAWQNQKSKIILIEAEPLIQDYTITNKNYAFSYNRISKMARLRNIYLEYIIKKNISGDYILVIDLDIYDFSIKGILYSLGLSKDWDVITANGKSIFSIFKPWLGYKYYDTYALLELNEKLPMSRSRIEEKKIEYMKLSSSYELIKVSSAFNGLALYKYEAFITGRYQVIKNDDEEVEVLAEHIGFHKILVEKGFSEIFINPCLVVYYNTYFSIYRKKLLKLIYATFHRT